MIISPDEKKKDLANYNPKLAEKFHKESAKLADVDFKKTIKQNVGKRVILMSGGSASGKTELIRSYLLDFNGNKGVIYDGTLSSIEGAKVKIRNIKKVKKVPQIFAVIPSDLRASFTVFLNRDRQFSDDIFYKTHSGARKVLLWVAKSHPEIEIKIFENSNKDEIRFKELIFDNNNNLIEYLNSIQYNEDEIIKIVTKS